jgi:DNA polymerase III subunit gamma/tau
MSNFVVSARKYRPIRFDSVVGQAHIANTLKKAISSDHLAQAFLFCGPRGVGKTTCARILAKVLNCERPTSDTEPCDECDSCKAFRENSSLNVYELDAASNNSVEHIRALIEQVRFAPQRGKYKIYIIDEVHMLSTAAFNAFLKTLEEPPSYAIFILATTEKHKIIPTILSRCQIFDFNRIQISDMAAHLRRICEQEGIEPEEEALHVIAQKADGALRDALSIFDRIVSFAGDKLTYRDVIDNLNILDYDYYFKITDALLTENTADLFLLFDNILHKGFDVEVFLNGLSMHLRNLLVCKDSQTLQLMELTGNIRARYAQQAHLSPKSFLITALSLLNDCDIHYKMARNKRLHIEIYLLKMAYINRTMRIQNMTAPNAGAGSEKKNLNNAVNTLPTSTQSPINTTTDAPKLSFKEKAALAKEKPQDMLAQIAEQSRIEIAQKAKEQAQTFDFTLANVQKLWEDYTATLPDGFGKANYSTAKLQIPDNQADTLQIQVISTLAKDDIARNGALIGILRMRLGNPNLQYTFTVQAATQQNQQNPNMPANSARLSPEERRQRAEDMLIDENPLVKDFKELFGLDFKNK